MEERMAEPTRIAKALAIVQATRILMLNLAVIVGVLAILVLAIVQLKEGNLTAVVQQMEEIAHRLGAT
jgi:hypothetical protein